MKILRNVVAIVALVVLLLLAFTNAQPIRLTAFGAQTPELPLFLFLLVAFALGYLLASLVAAVRQSGLNRRLARLERDIARSKGPASDSTDQSVPPQAGSV